MPVWITNPPVPGVGEGSGEGSGGGERSLCVLGKLFFSTLRTELEGLTSHAFVHGFIPLCRLG